MLNLLSEPDFVDEISNKLKINSSSVRAVLKLISQENTVPFIARYRKEVTNNMDENQIRDIIDLNSKIEALYLFKQKVLKNIDEQGKLTDSLEKDVVNSTTLKEVEDIYEPFKRTKKTKADLAREKGFEFVSNLILKQDDLDIEKNLLSKYSFDEIVSGGRDILIQDLVDDIENKKLFRFFFNKYGQIESKYQSDKKIDLLSDKVKKQVYKFEIYSNFLVDVPKLKSYQILALNRGENLGILNVKLLKYDIIFDELYDKYVLKQVNMDNLILVLKKVYKRLFLSIENEIRTNLTLRANEDAIVSFQENLEKLLMTKPQYGKLVLGIDPGFRTGCKIVVLDKNQRPVEFSKVFIEKENEAKLKLKSLISKYLVDVIVIGNGTGSNEILNIIKSANFNIPISVVNESGASVYSASDIAKQEFPNLDLTDRGTISIARRFIDPLSELVKIPVESIGVGMYQHDMPIKELSKKLGFVIEDVVNKVGININSSSVYVLEHISGLNKRSAKKVYDNIPYTSRDDLKKVLSKKAFNQAIGFLRISDSKEKLDNTNIHPEQYDLAKFIINNNVNLNNFSSFVEDMKKLYCDVNQTTVNDILNAYKNIGVDPRVYDAILKIDKTLNIEDLNEGDILTGVIRNIMAFGAFVDIGLKNDGLIHISEMADKFVKNPNEIVQIGQEVRVKIISIDIQKGKINLSLKNI